ncbi:uncharacterized protein BDV17DRAFT_293588 [Aspergillus undulatus]|uniref:uncharacterized protein n=1 Tax=Aspergillus undulatus TaxID=1810928 RepID=UPI003CCD7AB5
MPRIKQKTKEQDLARVRNNQRRCRQRKRDYVAELEQRLACIEETTSREIQRLRSDNDELHRENEKLTELLKCSGSNLSGQSAGTHDSLQKTNNDFVSGGNGFSLWPTDFAIPEDLSLLDFPRSPATFAAQVTQFTQKPSYLPMPIATGSDHWCSASPRLGEWDTTLSTGTSEDPYQDTTVCAVALEMVMKCNKRGLTILDLDMRLRRGYRSALFQWEGCRVDNRVLFAVLAEIR